MTVLAHTHGVVNNRCDHPDCRTAFARYVKQWRHERLAGVTRTTDPGPARLHILALVGHGMSLRSVAAEAGISVQVVSRLARGEGTRVTRRTEAALLAVPPCVAAAASPQTTEPFVPRVGTVRRIQALLALGWPHHVQTARSGVRTAVLLSQQGRWVTRSTHDAVAALYRDLSARPGPSPQTRGWARKLGYVSPVAWDDIDSDAEPDHGDDGDDVTGLDHVAVWRRVHGDPDVTLTPAEKAECIRLWRREGLSDKEIKRRTGWKVERYAPRRGEVA